MKSHIKLLQLVLETMGTRCRTSTTRDWKTITRRYEHEGMSFLTISLPQFCDDLQKGLRNSMVDPSLFLGYGKSGELPRFLGGFLDQVFNRNTGCLLEVPSVEAIQALRQILLLFGKVNLECSDSRKRRAITKYLKCEQDIKLVDIASKPLYKDWNSLCLRVWGDIFQKVDEDIYYGRIIPKHGPGTTADRLIGNDKFNQTEWTERLEKDFPHGEFLFPNWRYFNSAQVNILEPGAERPVKVILVPKTLKTPRVIAVEPTCMQYTQQGILESLVGAIESDDLLSQLVGFSDQVPNQDLARIGSLSGNLATLDLSEASDRVSNQLVRSMVHHFPNLRRGLDATRSRKADVPGEGVIRLSKYASMGSALCFPVEAIVFLTTILLGIQDVLRRPLTRKDLLALVGQVRVYGDDIIVPVEYVRSVVDRLQTFGFVVNVEKSFWTGKFRESCGKEFFSGEDVSVVRVRRLLPTQRRHVPEIISTVSLRNQLYNSGLWGPAAYLDHLLERLIPFPRVLPESPALGRHSFLGFDTEKECQYLQKPLVRAAVVYSKSPPSFLDGPNAMLKCFLKRGEQPFIDRMHLERAGRPKTVDIKLRWVSPT